MIADHQSPRHSVAFIPSNMQIIAKWWSSLFLCNSVDDLHLGGVVTYYVLFVYHELLLSCAINSHSLCIFWKDSYYITRFACSSRRNCIHQVLFVMLSIYWSRYRYDRAPAGKGIGGRVFEGQCKLMKFCIIVFSDIVICSFCYISALMRITHVRIPQ